MQEHISHQLGTHECELLRFFFFFFFNLLASYYTKSIMHFFFELTKFNTHNSNHISETNKTFKKFMSPATKKQDGSYTTNKKIHTKKSHAMTLAIPKHTKK